MTTAAVPATPARIRAVPAAAKRPGLPGTLRSELTKIVSVRSTYWTLLAQVLASIGWAVANCAGVASHGIGSGFNAAEASLTGQVALGELIIVVLGALVITSEYSTGMIRTSLAVMPRRGVLYAAKAMVFAAVTFILSLITSFTASSSTGHPVQQALQHHADPARRAARRTAVSGDRERVRAARLRRWRPHPA